VFSCGELIARRPGALVITVFAGVPDISLLTPWDRDCGFTSPQQAIAVRRREDRSALALLGAEPSWLQCLDSQYRQPVHVRSIARRLDRVLRRREFSTVALPLGLFHSDHELVHEAALEVMRRRTGLEWLAYEEANYRLIPGLVEKRLSGLAGTGVRAEALRPSTDGERAALKERAVLCYRSQLRGLSTEGRPGHADALCPERYWRLSL
jgi:LmbE family N-acetylglucosaminyl deacetylase